MSAIKNILNKTNKTLLTLLISAGAFFSANQTNAQCIDDLKTPDKYPIWNKAVLQKMPYTINTNDGETIKGVFEWAPAVLRPVEYLDGKITIDIPEKTTGEYIKPIEYMLIKGDAKDFVNNRAEAISTLKINDGKVVINSDSLKTGTYSIAPVFATDSDCKDKRAELPYASFAVGKRDTVEVPVEVEAPDKSVPKTFNIINNTYNGPRDALEEKEKKTKPKPKKKKVVCPTKSGIYAMTNGQQGMLMYGLDFYEHARAGILLATPFKTEKEVPVDINTTVFQSYVENSNHPVSLGLLLQGRFNVGNLHCYVGGVLIDLLDNNHNIRLEDMNKGDGMRPNGDVDERITDHTLEGRPAINLEYRVFNDKLCIGAMYMPKIGNQREEVPQIMGGIGVRF